MDETEARYRQEKPSRVSEPVVYSPMKRRGVWLTVALVAAGVFLLDITIDFFLVHQPGLRPVTFAAILHVAFAATAAAIVYHRLSRERERRTQVLERLQTIDEMNHHIRNALQVIAFSAHGTTDAEIAEIKKAVDRIQWSLCEVLPKVEPSFAVFQRSARSRAQEGSSDTEHVARTSQS